MIACIRSYYLQGVDSRSIQYLKKSLEYVRKGTVIARMGTQKIRTHHAGVMIHQPDDQRIFAILNGTNSLLFKRNGCWYLNPNLEHFEIPAINKGPIKRGQHLFTLYTKPFDPHQKVMISNQIYYQTEYLPKLMLNALRIDDRRLYHDGEKIFYSPVIIPSPCSGTIIWVHPERRNVDEPIFQMVR